MSAPIALRRRSALRARGVIALARQKMGAKSSPARAQEVRANAKATPPSGGGVRAIDERPPAKVLSLGPLCSRAQSASSSTFFGLMHWRYAESDDGN